MATVQQERIGYREGSRWIHEPPEPDELAKWFGDNVRVHDGLEHTYYLPGVTMIPNKERVKRTIRGEDGSLKIVDVEQLVYVPYPKAETRIAYFWDLMWHHPEWLGAIEIVPAEEPHRNLPPGFYHRPVTVADGKVTHFIGVSYQVSITERRGGRPVIKPAIATKEVPLLKVGWQGRISADEDAVHKAQTVGQARALGYAGMLVVPGAGIATAEDMTDFIANASGATVTPELPPVAAPNGDDPAALPAADLAAAVELLVLKLESEHPKAYEEAAAWAQQKGYELQRPPEAALRGLERMLRKKIDQAASAAAEAS